jgi:polysaccharide pyruvyl transferase WcaK-like protein
MSTAKRRDLGAGMPRRPILVIGGYGYRNVGDDAILAGLLHVLGREGVTVVSRMPAETAARFKVASVGIAEALPALRRHRGVVIGGGGLFGRDMGLVGRLLPAFGLFAAMAGRDVALVGVGIDGGMPRVATGLVRALARRATRVVVRDEASAAELASAGIDVDVRDDLSTFAPSAGLAAGRRLLRSAGLDPMKRPVVGLSLTAVDPELVEPVLLAVMSAVDALPSVDFCVVPMSRHPFVAAHNDELLVRRIAALRPRVRVLATDDPAAVLGVFEALSAAVCMRYHSLLFAERAGIPIIPIAYAEKCRHWLDQRGLVAIEVTAAAMTREIRRAVDAGEAVADAAPDPVALGRSA